MRVRIEVDVGQFVIDKYNTLDETNRIGYYVKGKYLHNSTQTLLNIQFRIQFTVSW